MCQHLKITHLPYISDFKFPKVRFASFISDMVTNLINAEPIIRKLRINNLRLIAVFIFKTIKHKLRINVFEDVL